MSVPHGWRVTNLGESGVWTGGGTPSKSNPDYWANGSTHWVSPKDMKRTLIDSAEDQITELALEESAAKLIDDESVLMVTRSGILAHSFPVATNSVPVALNQDMKAITPHEGIRAKFLARFLQSRAHDVLATCSKSGTTVSSIDTSALEKYAVHYPPIADQDQLLDKIDQLFSRIDEGERALRTAETLVERYRQSVLKAAVTGELTRDWRAANRERLEAEGDTGQALLDRILTARRQAWEAAELEKLIAKGKPPKTDAWKAKYKPPAAPDTDGLPELPEGWVWVSPDQLASPDAHSLAIGPFGSNLKVADYTSSGVPLIFVRNIRSNSFVGQDTKFVSRQKAQELTAHHVSAGDLLITKMGDPPGDVAVTPLEVDCAVITADCIKWRLSSLLQCAPYFAHALKSPTLQFQIGAITKGVAQQKISLRGFRTLAVPLPPVAEQIEIAQLIDTQLSNVEAVSKSLTGVTASSGALRQSVLRSAFSGQLISQHT